MDGEVLITGSSGRIGSVLQNGLAGRLRPFDLPDDDARNYDSLAYSMRGCTGVVHLAWDTATENFTSGQMNPDNNLTTMNVYTAAEAAGVKRVVMASSINADSWRPGDKVPISPFRLPWPNSPYGASKCFMEALGRYFSRRILEVVCVRFGGVGLPGERPSRQLEPWEGWISARDCVSLVQRCLDRPEIPGNFAIVYGLSASTDSVYDRRNMLEWTPQDEY